MENEKLRLITAIVQRSHGSRVIDAAVAAGATGATFFYAQGTGVRQKLGVLANLIEAEKQVVLAVATIEKAKEVVRAVIEAGELRKPAFGFVYVQDVVEAYGFIENSTA